MAKTTILNFHQQAARAPAGPSRIDVHEHRAPTDDSIRLAHEMEAKARDSVTAMVMVSDTPVEVLIWRMEEDIIPTLNAKAKINGTEVKVKVQIDRGGPNATAAELVRELGKAIAETALREVFATGAGDIFYG